MTCAPCAEGAAFRCYCWYLEKETGMDDTEAQHLYDEVDKLREDRDKLREQLATIARAQGSANEAYPALLAESLSLREQLAAAERERDEYQREADDESVWKNSALARAEKAEAELAGVRESLSSMTQDRDHLADELAEAKAAGRLQCDKSGVCARADRLAAENAALKMQETAFRENEAQLRKEWRQDRAEKDAEIAALTSAIEEARARFVGSPNQYSAGAIFGFIDAALAPKGAEAKPCGWCSDGSFICGGHDESEAPAPAPAAAEARECLEPTPGEAIGQLALARKLHPTLRPGFLACDAPPATEAKECSVCGVDSPAGRFAMAVCPKHGGGR